MAIDRGLGLERHDGRWGGHTGKGDADIDLEGRRGFVSRFLDDANAFQSIHRRPVIATV